MAEEISCRYEASRFGNLSLWVSYGRIHEFVVYCVDNDDEKRVQTSSVASVSQPFYTRGTLNIIEESWRHTNPILHIVCVWWGGRWFMLLIGRDNFL
jgi:hypothetical protein